MSLSFNDFQNQKIKFDITKFSRIKSISNFPLIVSKAFGIPSDKGLNLVASPPTNRYISLIIIQNI